MLFFNTRFWKLILAALLAVPAAPVGAWDELCMRFPIGKTWFAGRFYVIHEFNVDGDHVPERILGPDFSGPDWRAVKDRFNELDASLAEAERSIVEAVSLQFPIEDLMGESKRQRAIKEATAVRNELRAERDRLMENIPPATPRIGNLNRVNLDLSPAVAKKSGTILAGQTKCVSISDIPVGGPFYVLLKADLSPTLWDFLVCKTHPTNPRQWYLNQERPYSRIEYKAWGHVWTRDGFHCQFDREY